MYSKKIALFISHIYGEYQRNLTQGIIDKALEYGYQIQVITTNDGEALGTLSETEECILRLPVYSNLSGVIFASGTYASRALRDKVCEALKDCSVPVIEVNDTDPFFPNVTMDNNSMLSMIVSHFITMHGAKRICYLGCKNEPDISGKRLSIVSDSMSKNGLSFTDEDVYICDETPEDYNAALDHLSKNGTCLPDAIICYNDRLAYELIIAAENKGYKIPEDFGISGCDNSAAGQNMIPALTTISYPVYDLGQIAVDNLHSLIRGKERSVTSVFAKVIYGGSCGCSFPADKKVHMYTHALLAQIADLEKSIIMSSKIASAFGAASDLEDMLDLIASYAGEIENCTGFYLALSSNWNNLSDKILTLTASADALNDDQKEADDSLTLYLALQNGKRLPSCTFKRNTLLPDFLMSDNENARVVSPIYNHNNAIGYIVMTFENNRVRYPFKLIQYLVNLSQLLNTLRNKKRSDGMALHLEEIYMKDDLTGLYSKAGFDYYKNKYLYKFKAAGSSSTDDPASDLSIYDMTVDVDNLKEINEKYGRESGDLAISVIGQAIKKSLPEKNVDDPSDEQAIAGRINGGTFEIIIHGTEAQIATTKKKILSYLDNYNRLNPKPYTISATITTLR